MTVAAASLLVPLNIGSGMVMAGTSVPVVDSSIGEIAWSASTAYVGDEDNVNYEGKLWSAVAANTNVKPGSDFAKWRSTGPSNRMAPFDNQINTQAQSTGELTYVLSPGFFNGIALYGLVGDSLEIKLYDSPGGAVIYEWSGDMYEQAMGLFEYLFMPLRMITKKLADDLPLSPEAELHITIRASNDGAVGIGLIACGFWSSLLGGSPLGGVRMGASATIKTYSYIKTEDDGTTTIIPRSSATNINCSIAIDAEQANYAADILAQVAAKPVAIVLSGLPRYEYLNTFGLISGSVEASTWRSATLSLTGKGFI